jgi:choline dehydrogenase-like flavoprotein
MNTRSTIDETTSRAVPDVCVVGGGPAGLTTAETLGARGRRVVLIESGGTRSSVDAQELNDGVSEGVPYAGLRRTRHRQMGGTANTWNVVVSGAPGAKYVPLSRRDVAEWPISWDELEPFYLEAQRLCGLGPFEYRADHWTAPGARPFELGGTGLTNGVYQFGEATRFTRDFPDRLQASDAVTVVTPATVVELVIAPGASRVQGVRIAESDGRFVEIEARTVVLACGAVENARLLLLADPGVGTGSEWLGRCFMEHARDFSLTLVPRSRELLAEAGFYDAWTSADGFVVGGHLALTDEAIDDFGLPNAAMTLVPRARGGPRSWLSAHAPGPLRRAVGIPPGRYGWSRARSPAKQFDCFRVILNLEQRPRRSNRVELSQRRDRFGNPLPRLVLQWTAEEQAGLQKLRGLIREWFHLADVGNLLTAEARLPDLNAHHHAGTTRMAHDPRDGVVDVNGRVFGVDNLYLAGASVFPRAGFANPTLTIVALARRLGRHLDAVL